MRTIRAYAVERLSLRIFGPAIAASALVASWAAAADAPAVIVSTALMALLFVEFRLWDDLKDADRDRAAHPSRVLASAKRLPFQALLVVLLAATGALLAESIAAVVFYAGLVATSWCGYRWLRCSLSDRAWRFGVLLAKYPAFVVIVAHTVGDALLSRIAAGALCSYAAACGYEVWHHDRVVHTGAEGL